MIFLIVVGIIVTLLLLDYVTARDLADMKVTVVIILLLLVSGWIAVVLGDLFGWILPLFRRRKPKYRFR